VHHIFSKYSSGSIVPRGKLSCNLLAIPDAHDDVRLVLVCAIHLVGFLVGFLVKTLLLKYVIRVSYRNFFGGRQFKRNSYLIVIAKKKSRGDNE